MTASELATRAGVIRQTIYAIEAGSYVPNTEVALRIAQALEVSVEDLFQLEASPEAAVSPIVADCLSTGRPGKGQAVRTCKVGKTWVGVPVSAAPYYLPEADGVITEVDRHAGLSKVRVFSQNAGESRRLVLAGCDPAASLLAHTLEKMGEIEVVHAPASSQLALDWLRSGKVHIAGSHLEDPKTGDFNVPFVRRQFARQDMAVVTFAEWEVGLVVAHGNPKSIGRMEDLARKNCRFINRQPGSGSRSLLDRLLRKAGIPSGGIRGYDRVAAGHLAAAYPVFSGEADCCLATQSAAKAYGLDFVPLHRERYDFVLSRETLDMPAAQILMDILQRASLRRKLETLAGYDTRKTGALLH
jgi:molybdate-binding protein/DNA-binding XRE family transcriptional regulator